MHKKIPKICTGCRVIAAKIYLYHSTKIAKARPHSEECQTDSSVQKQWSMVEQSKPVCFLVNKRHVIVVFFANPGRRASAVPKNGHYEYSIRIIMDTNV